MTLHILATGTSRGIGAAIAAAFGNDDVRLIGHATTTADDRTIAVDLDLAGAADMLWRDALDRLDGRIDVLINNAGVFEAAPIDLADAEWDAAWERTFRIDLTASAQLCRHAVRHWRGAGRGGRIVNVASRAAYRGDSPDHWSYAAAKAGMVGLTKTIARGYAHEGILAFAVCPGFVATAMADAALAPAADIPLGRVATPQEVAGAVRYLALDAPPSMTGASIDINGASFVR
ncbi:SDR family NAD(P)-dependent oxidoreductase [Sphingomonas nostoxanthinifaciens]|uniref:SDR family NAD(P)-dependent oxidoreductase n=1 Tax=Sphingomonas nostoxanthinifaciens TaxID=2872652 RepID=UPI001CC21E89|nr:SDR family oxidoreductase [Sphingomonas nostoxanthinifaciens]UAK25969.1 SDR family oxidoreductase [Sphingomonas nostoxanthinifaciens]